MKKFADIQSELEKRLSAPTSPLQALTPKGHRVRVTIIDKTKKRKARSDRAADKWSPSNEIRISFEPGNTPAPAASKPAAIKNPLAEMVRALDHAENTSGYDFISLKWFRDTVLPAAGFAWTATESSRQDVLRDAIEKRLVLTGKAPNPKAPQFPVTSIRLNRLVPEVQAILGARPSTEADFEPLAIRGENLSATILSERR